MISILIQNGLLRKKSLDLDFFNDSKISYVPELVDLAIHKQISLRSIYILYEYTTIRKVNNN